MLNVELITKGGLGENTLLNGSNDFRKGWTSRFQLGFNIDINEYLLSNLNYILRKEPNIDKLEQRMTAELKAIF